MRVVVIGATGNVGTALLRALARRGRGRRDRRRRPAAAGPRDAEVRWTRPTSPATTSGRCCAGADAVVHLAWLIQPSRDEAVTHEANVEGSRASSRRRPRPASGARLRVLRRHLRRGPKDRAVDESWPRPGSRRRSTRATRRRWSASLDSFEAAHPEIRVVRLRPGLIFQRDAASEIRRLFAGPFLPSPLVRRELVPIVPRHPRLRFQAVHADDVADAYRPRARHAHARGAFNIAADPLLDPTSRPRRSTPARSPSRRRVLRGRGGADLARAPAAGRAGLGRHGARGPGHGHDPRARGARLVPAREPPTRCSSCSTACATAPDTRRRRSTRPRAARCGCREFLTGVGRASR